MVAKLVAECAQERSEGGDLFVDGGPHPDANQFPYPSLPREPGVGVPRALEPAAQEPHRILMPVPKTQSDAEFSYFAN
jgi:hypothetical protein